MTQVLDPRSRMVELTSALLLGPLAENEILTSPPASTYVTGILWPRGTTIGAEEDDGAMGGQDSSTSEVDAGVPGYRAVRPCSIGLSFTTGADTSLLISLGTTARYSPLEGKTGEPPTKGPEFNPSSLRKDKHAAALPQSTALEDPASDSVYRSWVRQQLNYSVQIAPSTKSGSWSINEWKNAAGEAFEDEYVTLHIRRRVISNEQIVTLTLINSAPEPALTDSREESCLFQSQIVVRALSRDGENAYIRPRQAAPYVGDEGDAASAALLYRDKREFAVGHGVAAMWSATGVDTAEWISTEWLPHVKVKNTSAKGHASLLTFLDEEPEAFHAAWLSQSNNAGKIITSLRMFTERYGAWIVSELEGNVSSLPSQVQPAALRHIQHCQSALKRMIAGIDLLEEDRTAWEAFALANQAMNRQSRFKSKGSKAGPLVWRPFQLGFLLMVIPGLADGERFSEDRHRMDLLWFPTGGGKTEAYLGLTAFIIFYRRLSDASHAVSGGVDVIMRYTLRLLTVQQFQRAAALIAACDFIRQERRDLGTTPISIGLYVGRDTTPNRIADAASAIEEEQNGGTPKSTPRQLLACPVCGVRLPSTSYSVDEDEYTVTTTCAENGCETAGRPLSVITVDDHIYKSPPSLLIGTIDKFAQLPRRQDLGRLFGLDGRRRPELIIQDELHLISGPLGSMTGLYETAIDFLCTDDGIPPKIIGSTATIGQAERQVRALFNRQVSQFPPSGFDANDSFFAVQDDDGPDRLYLGMSSAGRSPKFTLQAASAALLQSVHTLRQREDLTNDDLDALWTCVLYFNSIRELGGAYSLLQDDIPRQIDFLASRLSVTGRELQLDPVEISSRVSSRELPEKLAALSASMSSATGPFAEEPKDTVLASNMISVGVDIPRLGLMLVNGQPKSTSEYIQATSRVGRGIDGLVLTIYNFGRPRDLSHFEHFAGYHSALYQGVEATSVTPWAPRARDKALHAVFVAIIRHLVEGMQGDKDAVGFDLNDPLVAELGEFIISRAKSASNGVEEIGTQEDLRVIIQEWARRTETADPTARLSYWEVKTPIGSAAPHLMYAAEEGTRRGSLAWPTPNSMREVEPSAAFVLKQFGRD